MDMKVYMKNVVLSLSLAAMLLTACGGSPGVTEPTATAAVQQQPPAAALVEVSDEPTSAPAADSSSGLPADLETYYKTMVFIEGTAQLMSKFDLAAVSDDSAGFLPLIAIPGTMDDRVLATEKTSLPDGLAPSWEKALEARDGILQAFETLLTTNSQDNYIKQMGDSLILASEAVAETEAIAASNYGATSESIALANRAALTEMGEAYQTFASMSLLLQSMRDDDPQ
jgi:hypothetical protein